jgi:hypothetical protein
MGVLLLFVELTGARHALGASTAQKIPGLFKVGIRSNTLDIDSNTKCLRAMRFLRPWRAKMARKYSDRGIHAVWAMKTHLASSNCGKHRLFAANSVQD